MVKVGAASLGSQRSVRPEKSSGELGYFLTATATLLEPIYLYMHINSYFCLHLSSRVAESLWVPCSADLYLIRKSLVSAGVLLDQASADPGK